MQRFNTHFSIINSYASYFGIPITMLLIGAITATGQNTTDYSQLGTSPFYWGLFFSVLSAMLDICSQIIWIISVKFDDVSKIAMYRASDLLFTFIVQYFLLDHISSNALKYVGAVLITCSMVLIMGFKVVDVGRQRRREQDEGLGLTVNGKESCFERFIFFKI